MNRFLVTGATGFIGSAVVRWLERERQDVVAVATRDIDLLAASQSEIDRFVDESGATHCIHCAWYTNHADYLVHDINRGWLAATLCLAHACRSLRFVGLGTCLEYDVSTGEPFVEDETPIAPQTLYATCKRDVYEALTASGSDHAWARVFFVYGPGDRAGRLIPGMLERFRRGERAGATFGGLRRDYIHVDDLAGQIARITISGFTGAVNTGTGEAPTLSDIFVAGARAFGTPELAERNNETGGQPALIQADMTRFRSQIGNVDARNIERGLADLVG